MARRTEPYDAPANVTQRKHSETSAGNSRSSAFAHRAVVLRGSSCVTLLSTPRFHSPSSEPFLPKRKRARCGGNSEVLILNVRPRSYLDAGNVVPVGSMNYPASGYG